MRRLVMIVVIASITFPMTIQLALAGQLPPGGYIQTRLTQVQNDDTGAGGDQDDSFGIKRAKLWVKGNVSDDIGLNLMGIYSGASYSLNLLDARLTFKLSDRHKLLVGQYLTPFSLEDLSPDWKIYTINRARVVDKLSPNRDIGVTLKGVTKSKILDYSLGIFNGAGKNTDANCGNDNDKYLYVGRLVFRPKIGSVKMGIGMNYARNCLGGGYARVDDKNFVGDEDLFGFDLALDWNVASLRAEYIKAQLNPDTGADVEKGGFYVQLAYSHKEKYQLALKYEEYDADDRVKNNKDKQWTTIGLNHYIRGNGLRISYNYVLKGEDGASIDDNTFLAQLQVMF